MALQVLHIVTQPALAFGIRQHCLEALRPIGLNTAVCQVTNSADGDSGAVVISESPDALGFKRALDHRVRQPTNGDVKPIAIVRFDEADDGEVVL